MPTSSRRPHRAGARASAAVLAALTATGATMIMAPAAVAAPGDNGDVKIHKVGSPLDGKRDQPRVCDFYLAAFDFDPSQSITWTIDNQPSVPGADPVAEGSIALEPDGSGHTSPVMPESPADAVRLPDGQYRLTWKTVGSQGAGEHKVFHVECPPAGPNGGPPAGGGGLAMTQNFSPVTGAAAVGLVAVGGVVFLRLRRRRADGAA